MMISSLEKFIQTLRWRVIFFLSPFTARTKETYGFKTLKIPEPVDQLKDFEKDLFEMIKNIEFRDTKCKFQNKLSEEKNFIRVQDKLIVAADKTPNYYLLDNEKYHENVEKNVQKDFKKVDQKTVDAINESHKSIVRNLELQDRVFKTTDKPAFITCKDHKDNFQNSPTFRTINPRKGEVGRIAKKILSRILSDIKSKSNLQQMENVYSVIDWYKKLNNKKSLSFIIFDVVNYYPSITLELLEKAIRWARGFTNITDEEKNTLIESKKSLLFLKGAYWSKKGSNFDNAQGSYDGAECCDLIGLYMLNEIKKLKLNLDNILYRDDGLGVSSARPRQIEIIKKKLCTLFNSNGLRITVDANKKVVQYLDVELNLQDETFKPYLKENGKPVYVNCKSNHPPSVLSNIPRSINKRLSLLSSNEDMFNSVVAPYQEECWVLI